MNLDELQLETEKLLSLLKDRQTGLITWNSFLRDRLCTIHALIEKAGISSQRRPA
jgi:hypothetical protein